MLHKRVSFVGLVEGGPPRANPIYEGDLRIRERGMSEECQNY